MPNHKTPLMPKTALAMKWRSSTQQPSGVIRTVQSWVNNNNTVTSSMRHSVARLAQAAKTAAAPATGSTGAPSPYAWVNTATAGPSSGMSGRVLICADQQGPLSGRAIAIKDNISYTGAPTSCGSDILEGEQKEGMQSQLTVRLCPTVRRDLCQAPHRCWRAHLRQDQDGRIRHGVG